MQKQWRAYANRNQIFFNNARHRFDYPRVSIEGSFTVVSNLLGQNELDQRRPLLEGASRGRRPQAFFDTDGNFYDRMLLQDIVELTDDSGTPLGKHCAVFEFFDEQGSHDKKTIKIDDIYCLSAAVVDNSPPPSPPDPDTVKLIELKSHEK